MSEKTYTSNIPGTPDMSHRQQFVLERANMTDPFTDNDYNSCIEALGNKNAVAIHWKQGDTVRQLQLASKTNLGALSFSYVRNNKVETWTIAAASPHTITHTEYDLDDVDIEVKSPLKFENGVLSNGGTDLNVRGDKCWAEGESTTAGPGTAAHAEGHETAASNDYSHSEGMNTAASGIAAHAEGRNTRATAQYSHAEGQDTLASGPASHASGKGTKVSAEGGTAVGKYNSDTGALFVVGDGTGGNSRSDAFKVDANGDTWVKTNGVLSKIANVEADCQYVLFRSNMSASFTDEEYNTCISETNARHSVVVQFGSGGLAEAQLNQIKSDGALVFSRCEQDTIVTYTVAPGQTHTIVASVDQIPHPESQLSVKLGGTTRIYTPTGPDVSLDVDAEISRVYLAKGSASVATLNAGIAGIQNGWSYVLTDGGTLALGNVSVAAGDNVAWDGSQWFKIGNQVSANVLSVIIERTSEETDADFKITNGVTRAQLDNAVNEGTPIKATIKRGSNTYVTSLFTLTGTPHYFVVWLHTWQTTPSLRAIAIDTNSNCHWVSSNFTTPSGWEPPYTE